MSAQLENEVARASAALYDLSRAVTPDVVDRTVRALEDMAVTVDQLSALFDSLVNLYESVIRRTEAVELEKARSALEALATNKRV